MTWKPCSGSGASVSVTGRNGTLAVAGYAILAGFAEASLAAREAGHAVREMERGWCRTNSGRWRDAKRQTSEKHRELCELACRFLRNNGFKVGSVTVFTHGRPAVNILMPWAP